MNIEQIMSLKEGLVEFLRPFETSFAQRQGMKNLEAYSVGLLTDVKRKSIEPIALAAGRDERTLQWFLAQGAWDHDQARALMQYRVASRHDLLRIGVLDASGHVKKGDKTPGVQRQWCGEVGKKENCVVGQHLLYTNNDPANPFSCMLASDLFLPESWDQDRERCRRAKIPDAMVHHTKWRIGIEQLELALGHGVRFDWVTFDEDYGNHAQFWFELDRLGLRAIGEVRATFFAWATPPCCRSGRAEHAAKRADNLVTYSPAFRKQPWVRFRVKTTTVAHADWEVKAAPVQLVHEPGRNRHDARSVPSQRRYWLIVARSVAHGEIKYFLSNALDASLEEMLRAAWTRFHVEMWFERAKQEVGLGAFEMRNYPGLMRHWLICSMVMLFLTEQTNRLRGEKPGDHIRAGRTGGQSDCLGSLGPPAPERGQACTDQLLLPTS